MKIAYISSHLPRQCGIATFNHNLKIALDLNFSDPSNADKSFSIAVHDGEEIDGQLLP